MKLNLIKCDAQAENLLAEAIELKEHIHHEDGPALTLTQREKDGYHIRLDDNGCQISYHTYPQMLRAIWYVLAAEGNLDVEERCGFKEFGIMYDQSRNAVFAQPTIEKVIRMAAYMGYSYVGLYMEDTMQVENEPYFGYMRGALTAEEIRHADAYAARFGIELRPFIQTLAHLNQIVRYAEYSKITDVDDILLIGEERTEQLIENMIRSVSNNFTTRKINIGMDEAHMVGLGKYLDKHGYQNRMEIMTKHLERVLAICEKYGFTAQMWSDMFFRLAFHGDYYDGEPEDLQEVSIPDNVELGYWDYYTTDEARYDKMIRMHHMMTDKVAFMGGAWKWSGMIPYNRFSIEAGKAAIASCRRNHISSVTITCWGDNGAEASAFSILPTLFADAQLAYESGMGEEAFQLMTGYTMEEFLLIDDVNPYIKKGVLYNNSSKYLLYNDPMIGTFDSLVRDDTAAHFVRMAEKLGALTQESPFFYVMDSTQKLCLVLAMKADLGVRLKKAYDANDKATLKTIAENELAELLKRMDDFYETYRSQWYRENKSFGFEVQTIRIGGLIRRLKDTRQLLFMYVNGEIDAIQELEQKRLPFAYFEGHDIDTLDYNTWINMASPSRI